MTAADRMPCPYCAGSGLVTERHDYAVESLGCPDCHGEGLAPEGWVPPPVDVQRIDGKWWVLVEGRRVSDHRNADAARIAAQGHLR